MNGEIKDLIINLQAETISAYKTINVLVTAVNKLIEKVDHLEQAVKPKSNPKPSGNDIVD